MFTGSPFPLFASSSPNTFSVWILIVLVLSLPSYVHAQSLTKQVASSTTPDLSSTIQINLASNHTPKGASSTFAGRGSKQAANTSFQVSSPYPNPFNPQTTFELAVAREQHVTVEAYNLLGARVALLYDDILPAKESHTFAFEATDLPSGLYLIRTTGETFINTQRVTLLK